MGKCVYTNKNEYIFINAQQEIPLVLGLGLRMSGKYLLQLALPKDIMSDTNTHHLCCLFVYLLLSVSVKHEFDDKNYVEYSTKKTRTDEAMTNEEIY